MRSAACLLYFLLLCFSATGQIPPSPVNQSPTSSPGLSRLMRTNSTEQCSNLLDDDLNGLRDFDDYGCYYSPENMELCKPNNILWASSNQGLHWYNMQTGEQEFVGSGSTTMGDIAWTSDGRLFGVGLYNGKIWELDPGTGEAVVIDAIPGYYAANGLTSDGAGNLFLAAFVSQTESKVIRLNLSTWEVTLVADLFGAGLVSGGDLTFMNGFIYLGTANAQIAKIDVSTGAIQTFALANSPFQEIRGLTTMGDGFLYMTTTDRVYKIDPVTMAIDFNSFIVFSDLALLLGLATYAEACNAPGCHGRIWVENLTPTVQCSNPGATLSAIGTGIPSGIFTWTTPSGNSIQGSSIVAQEPGTYRVQYFSTTDFCSVIDSIDVNLIPQISANLGGDTILCPGVPLLLKPVNASGITSYNWSTGSQSPQIVVSQAGTYWLEASTICGSSRDTVTILTGTKPEVSLTPEVQICPGDNLILKNNFVRTIWDNYLWVNGSTADSVVVNSPGSYWLQSSNSCGIFVDTTVVIMLDSCTCFPFWPLANLGPDKYICSYDSVLLQNNQHHSGFDYIWSNGSTASSITVKNPGLYWVDVLTYCGTVRDSVWVHLKPEGCERNVFVPTAFTPNRDNHNEQFKPHITGTVTLYDLKVFNRWGQLLFHTTDPNAAWDGKWKGQDVPIGVLVWMCTYQFSGESRQQQKGTVSLIR